jgi:hypothetical protein
MELYVNQIERVETNHVKAEPETGWTVHFVSTLDTTQEPVLWGDLSTDKPELVAHFQLGQRWTLTSD